jgi:hypothetical protein
MRKERNLYKSEEAICRYEVDTYPLSILNVQDFEDALNSRAGEGWGLKHIFTTVGLKLVVIWEK